MLTFHSGTYRKLEVFPEMGGDASALLCLRSDGDEAVHTAKNRTHVTFALRPHTVYALDTGGAAVRFLYLTDSEDLFERGVRFLGAEENAPMPHNFRPHFGLFLAPSAFCFYQGYYHMIYRCDLFGNGQTYLAHAVSRDLCTWRELPVLLTPPLEMCQSDYRKGGVSDAAIEVSEAGVRLYCTYRICEAVGGKVLLLYRMQSESRDMCTFSEGVPLSFPEMPLSFEGPHLAETAEGKYLLFGGNDRGAAAAFLYKNAGAVWKTVLREKKAKDWKNAALFSIGKTHAALGTFPKAEGEEVRWYAGTFRADAFRVRTRGVLDFGGDFRAPKSFPAEGRRILFGKIGDALSYPREISAHGGRLLVLPAREVYERRGEVLYAGSGESTSFRPKYPAYMVEVIFAGKTEGRFQFGEGADAVIFTFKGGKCAFSENATYKTDDATKLLFLVTPHSAEVFINDGETAGTKLGTCGGFFKASFSAPEAVSALSARALLPPDAEEEDFSFPCGETFEF